MEGLLKRLAYAEPSAYIKKYWDGPTEISAGAACPMHNLLILWRARRDSNSRPLPSEGSTLSS